MCLGRIFHRCGASKMILATGATLLCLVFVEVSLRIGDWWAHQSVPHINRQEDNAWHFYEYDPVLGWKNRARAQGLFAIPDSETHVKINSLAMRDSEHSYKHGKRFRILVLGDSFTWGYGVEAEDRFTEKLPSLLSCPVEIINAGVTGYGTDQEYLYWNIVGHEFKPDLVLLAFGTEDIINVHNSIQYSYPKPYFTIYKDVLLLNNVPVPKRSAEWDRRFDLPDEAQSHAVESELIKPGVEIPERACSKRGIFGESSVAVKERTQCRADL